MDHRLPMLFFCLFFYASAADETPPGSGRGTDIPVQPFIAPAIAPVIPAQEPDSGPSVNWNGLVRQSMFFLGIEHAFRLATEPGTRAASGQLVRGYFRSVGNMHGWSDGDPFLVNYIGHPMQGAVAGFMWTHNDPRYGSARFGKDPRYWKGRLRAAAFAWAYSTQFEIGPVSEASIGQIQAKYPAQGFVDHVVTPAFGLGWMVAEDAIDQYLLIPLERRVRNKYVRSLTRGFLNPSRSMANVVRGKLPFIRDDRSIFGMPQENGFTGLPVPRHSATAEERPDDGPAPFEVTVFSSQPLYRGSGSGSTCTTGGGAEAAFRMARQWQFVVEVNGCRLSGLKPYTTGDALTYLLGPRWTPSDRRLRPWAHFLIGGVNVNTEEISVETRSALEAAAQKKGLNPPSRDEYATFGSSNGLAISAGTGLNLKLARAAAIRLASLEYTRSWNSPLNGVEYNKGLELKLGLTLRMGTW